MPVATIAAGQTLHLDVLRLDVPVQNVVLVSGKQAFEALRGQLLEVIIR